MVNIGFIVLVYGFACLLFGFSAEHLSPNERLPLVLFTPIFPILVLILFAWLVTKHHDKLYGPGDYRTDEAFLQTLQQKIQESRPETKESKKSIEDLMEYGKEFSIISEQEKTIKADLKRRGLDFSNNTTKALIHHLAASQVLNGFERIYYALFGSQIFLLRFLNDDESGITNAFAAKYFEKTKLKYPEGLSAWTTDSYLRYPITSGLIKRDKRITITKMGNEFLTWLSKSGYTENKIL